MSENQLVEIPQNEWSTLQVMYQNKKKESSSWNLLQNYIDWLAKDPTIKSIKLFSLDGDWSDGTFIIQDGNTFMFNTLNDNQDRLFNALQCIDKVEAQSTADYNSLSDFVHRVKPTVDKFLAPIGVNVDNTAIWYHLPKDEALNFKVDAPRGVTVAPLAEINVKSINNLWLYRSPTSEAFISRLIRFNLHVGAFDEDGNLLAWCLQMPMGCLGILQVRDGQRRKGFGSLVVREISKKLAERGIEVTVPVVDSNIPSRSMFEKLGFKEIDQVHWVRIPRIH